MARNPNTSDNEIDKSRLFVPYRERAKSRKNRSRPKKIEQIGQQLTFGENSPIPNLQNVKKEKQIVEAKIEDLEKEVEANLSLNRPRFSSQILDQSQKTLI